MHDAGTQSWHSVTTWKDGVGSEGEGAQREGTRVCLRLMRVDIWQCMCVCMLSHFSRVHLFATPWTVACQAPLSLGFCRQECWSGVLCSPPGDLLNPRIKSASPTSLALAGGFSTTSTTWEEAQRVAEAITIL